MHIKRLTNVAKYSLWQYLYFLPIDKRMDKKKFSILLYKMQINGRLAIVKFYSFAYCVLEELPNLKKV